VFYVFMAHQQSCHICTLCLLIILQPLKKLAHKDRITAICLSGEHICGGHLRLSPAERGEGKTVALTVLRGRGRRQRKMQSLVALELLDLLARSHIPQQNAVVVLSISPAA
jgi:hypothetical protein